MDFYSTEECTQPINDMKSWDDATFPPYEGGMDHPTLEQNFLTSHYDNGQPPAFFHSFPSLTNYSYPSYPRMDEVPPPPPHQSQYPLNYSQTLPPQSTLLQPPQPPPPAPPLPPSNSVKETPPPAPDPPTTTTTTTTKTKEKHSKKKKFPFERVNIRDVINENELEEGTLAAQKEEQERMQRIWQAQQRAQQDAQQQRMLQQHEYLKQMQHMQQNISQPQQQQQTEFPQGLSGSQPSTFGKQRSQGRSRGSRYNKQQQAAATSQQERFNANQAWSLPSMSTPDASSMDMRQFKTTSLLSPPEPQKSQQMMQSPQQQSLGSWLSPSSKNSIDSSSSSSITYHHPEKSPSENSSGFFSSQSQQSGGSKEIIKDSPPHHQPLPPAAGGASERSILVTSPPISAISNLEQAIIKKEPIHEPPISNKLSSHSVFSNSQPSNTLLSQQSKLLPQETPPFQRKNTLLNKQLDTLLQSPVPTKPELVPKYPPSTMYAMKAEINNKEVILVSSEDEDEKPKPTFIQPKKKDGDAKVESDGDDDDCVMISDGEEDSDSDSVGESDMTGDPDSYYNLTDADGRILVNVGHPDDDPDIFLAPQITKAIKPHQVGGIRFLWDNVVESLERFKTSAGFGCILAHSMGLGKTVQVISFIDVFMNNTNCRHVVCIVPINTIQNWLTEFDMWTPPRHMVPDLYVMSGDVRPRTYDTFILNENHKTLSARANQLMEWHKRGGVMLMGYEMFRMLALKQTSRSKKKFKKDLTVTQELDEQNKKLFDEIYKVLVNPGPDLIICDEGHRIKNATANTSVALKNIKTRRRVVLTGYPLQNSLLEYWCMVDFIRPNYLGTKAEFCNMFERPITNGQCIDSTPRDRQLMRFRSHVLHSLLEGFVQRRGHSVLRKALPTKDEHVLLVRMSEIQRKLYKAFVSDLLTVQNAANPLKLFAVCCKIWNHPDILYDLLQNQKIQAEENDLEIDLAGNLNPTIIKNHPRRRGKRQVNGMLNDPSMPPYRDKNDPSISYDWAIPLMADYIPGLISSSYKMTVLFAILEQSLLVGDKILVFSQSLFTLSLIEKILSQQEIPNRQTPERWHKGKNYFRLDGSTTAQEREKMIVEFNGNPNIYLFLLSTRAGCLGINLIGANRIVVLDASWNPCHDAQAVCRIYRYGQQKQCFIYRLIADNSLEKRIYDRQINKQGMSDRVVDELTPECNFTMKEVNTLAHENEDDNPIREYSEYTDTFNDHVLKHIYTQYNYCMSKEPFEHESLLSDRKDLKLTKQEKKMAKKSYEMEKRANMHGGNYSNRPVQGGMFLPNNNAVIRPWLNNQAPYNLLPAFNTPQSADGTKAGVLNNLLKPGCSVQKFTVPHDLTIPVTTRGLPPVHIKAGQEVMVMRTPKGVCLQLPGGRLVAIHLNQAQGGGDSKNLGGNGPNMKPSTSNSRVVQTSLHSGGMVSLRPGTSVLKRPTEVIDLSDDNDSDSEATSSSSGQKGDFRDKSKDPVPKPSISITPVNPAISGHSPAIKSLLKKDSSGPIGDPKWPSSLSSLNLPSNLSVSILPVSSTAKASTASSATITTTSSTGSPPSAVKLVKKGDKISVIDSPSINSLPPGINVSLLSGNNNRPVKVTKIVTSSSSSIAANLSLITSLVKQNKIPGTIDANGRTTATLPPGMSIFPSTTLAELSKVVNSSTGLKVSSTIQLPIVPPVPLPKLSPNLNVSVLNHKPAEHLGEVSKPLPLPSLLDNLLSKPMETTNLQPIESLSSCNNLESNNENGPNQSPGKQDSSPLETTPIQSTLNLPLTEDISSKDHLPSTSTGEGSFGDKDPTIPPENSTNCYTTSSSISPITHSTTFGHSPNELGAAISIDNGVNDTPIMSSSETSAAPSTQQTELLSKMDLENRSSELLSSTDINKLPLPSFNDAQSWGSGALSKRDTDKYSDLVFKKTQSFNNWSSPTYSKVSVSNTSGGISIEQNPSDSTQRTAIDDGASWPVDNNPSINNSQALDYPKVSAAGWPTNSSLSITSNTTTTKPPSQAWKPLTASTHSKKGSNKSGKQSATTDSLASNRASLYSADSSWNSSTSSSLNKSDTKIQHRKSSAPQDSQPAASATQNWAPSEFDTDQQLQPVPPPAPASSSSTTKEIYNPTWGEDSASYLNLDGGNNEKLGTGDDWFQNSQADVNYPSNWPNPSSAAKTLDTPVSATQTASSSDTSYWTNSNLPYSSNIQSNSTSPSPWPNYNSFPPEGSQSNTPVSSWPQYGGWIPPNSDGREASTWPNNYTSSSNNLADPSWSSSANQGSWSTGYPYLSNQAQASSSWQQDENWGGNTSQQQQQQQPFSSEQWSSNPTPSQSNSDHPPPMT